MICVSTLKSVIDLCLNFKSIINLCLNFKSIIDLYINFKSIIEFESIFDQCSNFGWSCSNFELIIDLHLKLWLIADQCFNFEFLNYFRLKSWYLWIIVKIGIFLFSHMPFHVDTLLWVDFNIYPELIQSM